MTAPPPIASEFVDWVERLHGVVDELVAPVAKANGARLTCRAGCHDCCTDGLSVFAVEAAVIARLAARVIAVEEDGALASAARVALGQVGAMNVDVVAGPLAAGWVQGAPYDVVFLNGAAEVLPPALIDQLAEGGRFVGVIREAGGVAHASAGRKGGGVLGLREFLDAGGAPLPGFDRPRGFRF